MGDQTSDYVPVGIDAPLCACTVCGGVVVATQHWRAKHAAWHLRTAQAINERAMKQDVIRQIGASSRLGGLPEDAY